MSNGVTASVQESKESRGVESLKKVVTGFKGTLSISALVGLFALSGCGDLAGAIVKYTAGVKGDAGSAHDGKLRWAAGVQNVQVVRSVASQPQLTDGSDTIYRHHSFVTYWNGFFWVMHDGGGARLAWSKDGFTWNREDAVKAFDRARVHRMGFYVSSNGRLLASHWMGNETGGLGTRLVREVYGPNSFGPEYMIKANYGGPAKDFEGQLYSSSSDQGFVDACNELLGNALVVEQWQEEDYNDPDFYAAGDGQTQLKAFSWYTLPDQRIVGIWKGVLQTVTTGPNWKRGEIPTPTQMDSFGYAPSAKTWGQRTSDGKYALVGNTPGDNLRRRWPLSVTTSKDGLDYDTEFLVIAGDLPPSRYENFEGDDKNAGPQYIRGISPGNAKAPDDAMWLTYSMNKEDIWVARAPVPLTATVNGDVRDDFESQKPGRDIALWNTYVPQWAPVTIQQEAGNRFLRLQDWDPADYASVMRVFETGKEREINFDVRPGESAQGVANLEVEVVSADGSRAISIVFDGTSRKIRASDGDSLPTIAQWVPSTWQSVMLSFNTESKTYDLRIGGKVLVKGARFMRSEGTDTLERLVFRTGAFRLNDFSRRPYEDDKWLTDRLPGADAVAPISRYDIDNVTIIKQSKN